ncbi:MAG: hypothetical protein SPF89_12205 [Sphaerochaetaceae bacterium]|nr:hypothetical protein [Spirochaetales bacterium]MDY5500856.1 hypothetical protein [Sphaerochaetaceae bacterium]
MRLWSKGRQDRQAFHPEYERPVVVQSICTGEQSLVFVGKDGSRRQVGLVKDGRDLKRYAREYGFDPDAVGREF